MRSDLTNRARRGFSLAEIMVALVLLGIVAGGIMTVVMRQQQFYRSATEVIDTRQQIRQAAAVVPVDLRGVSAVGNDIVAMSDSALDVRGNIGSGIVCSKTSAGGSTTFTIPGTDLPSGHFFTTFLTRPRVNDVMIVLDDRDAGNADDIWRTFTITGIDSSLVGCNAPAYMTALDATRYRYLYTVNWGGADSIIAGAPVRFARRVKYNIYQSASDRLWWMGYRECRGDGSTCDPIQPVAGPYRAYAQNDTINSGLTFVYRDSTGATTTDPTQVARVEMFVHGETQSPVALGGGKTNQVYRDYQKVTIALRNRH